MSDEVILELKNINVFYGRIHALQGIDLKIRKGEIVTILGANGAGKTTTLRTISGLIAPKEGDILFKGQSLLGFKAHKVVGMGMAHSPEGRLVFPELTVSENMDLGAYIRNDKVGIKKDRDYVFELFPRLRERLKQLAGTLSGGEQQMLAIGRALMSSPDLLLLDEPSLGIAPLLVQTIFAAIEEINRKGMTVLLVEQNAYAALKVANHGHVMETGRMTHEGEAKKLLHDPYIRQAYLGE